MTCRNQPRYCPAVLVLIGRLRCRLEARPSRGPAGAPGIYRNLATASYKPLHTAHSGLPRTDDTSGTTKTGAGARPPLIAFLLLVVAAASRRDLGPLAIDVRVLALLAQVLLEVFGPILVSLELVVHEL